MRTVGSAVGTLVVVYVVVVGAMFAGVPGLDRLDPPGMSQLTSPGGDQADVGADPVEQPVPADDGGRIAAVPDAPAPAPAPATGVGSETSVTPSPTDPVVPTPTPAGSGSTTTTTAVHGQSASTPSSTVPDQGGPPVSRGPK